MLKIIHGWAKDYLHMTHRHLHSFLEKDPPKHYLGHIVKGKRPVILIPGYLEKWHFLSVIAEPLSHKGHPIFVVRNLGYNAGDVALSAKLIRELIDEKKIEDCTIVAHSKGGLIGKYILAFLNEDKVVKRLVAVATPWAGSHSARFFPHKTAKNLCPNSSTISGLQCRTDVNEFITSVYGVFDNHVWPTSSCHLDGAKNIEIDTHGHHTILFDRKTVDTVVREAERM